MKSNFKRLSFFSILTIVLLVVSIIYRTAFFTFEPQGAEASRERGDRRVVSVWYKKDYYTDNIKALVNKYNNESKDIYIDFKVYDKDYFNMLKLSILTKNKPDIFSFGYYDYLRNGLLYSLDDLGVDKGSIGHNRFFYYGGEPMGVKLSGYTSKLVFNKDILKASGLNPDEAPKTWGDVLNYAERIKAAFPEITPIEFPGKAYQDIAVSIGQNSVNEGSVYTSFWNYKTGRYDFDYARQILSIYNEMYDRGLISKDFKEKDREGVRKDFAQKKAAMIISTYEDKVSFMNEDPLNFTVGISDMPGFKENQQMNYYYTANINILVAVKNQDNNEDVKSVYNWIVDRTLDKNSSGVLAYNRDNPNFMKYDDDKNFKYEGMDPTGSFDYDYGKIAKLLQEGIEGKLTVNEAIDSLNDYANAAMDIQEKSNPGYFENYIDRE